MNSFISYFNVRCGYFKSLSHCIDRRLHRESTALISAKNKDKTTFGQIHLQTNSLSIRRMIARNVRSGP